MPAQPPLISVFMLAYNHEGYIAQAIQSILDQKTDLEYELVIGEDCSTDNTRAVINDFKERYPHKINVIENTTNVGMHENFLRTLFSFHLLSGLPTSPALTCCQVFRPDRSIFYF